MTNNLAKIAKDLRAFAKRCKDVHYSDSLLISFILSGILSLASISFSDTFDNLSDSQKEAAMDSINEMRQQINYARKDNDKLIKGSSLELVKLMEQGDQVVKSPWGSQQFGFGYTYNSWGTSFKGRGGKQNDIKYRRTNDLTKYVYDPNLHEYGATNLHIKRNKEPDALTINPANVHEPYRPYTPERLDSINVPNAPTFNPKFESPLKIVNTVEPRNQLVGGVNPRNVITGGTGAKTVGDIATFQISSHIVRSFDGWNANTANTNTISANITNINSGSFTNGGLAEIKERDPSGSWWGSAIRTSTSTSYYSNVNGTTIAPGNPGGTTGSYYTPGTYWFDRDGHIQYSNNPSTGYDNINSDSYTYSNGITYNYNTTYSTVSTDSYNWYLNAIKNGGALAGEVTAVGSVAYWQTIHNPSTGTPGGNYNAAEAIAMAASSDTTNTTAATNYAASMVNRNNNSSISDGGKKYRDSMIDVRGSDTLNISNTDFHIGIRASGGAAMKVSDKGTINVQNTAVTLYKGTNDINVGYAIGTAGTNNASDTVNLKFSGTSNSIKNNQNGNIAFNFQEGVTTNEGTANVTGPVYIENYGDSNSIYRVNHFVSKLHVQNGKDASATTDLTSAGTDYLANSLSAAANGSIYVGGNNNIVFHNNAYVKEGSIALADVQIQGNNNVMAFFNNANGTVGAGNNAGWGAFGGNVNLQGVVGGNNDKASVSKGNVVVYAHSGQSDKLNAGYFGSGLSNNTGELKVTDINVGFGKYSSGDTLIYADNGTKVNVKRASGVITDGVRGMNGSVTRGYNVEEQESPIYTIIGYSTGQYVDKINGNNGAGWATGGGAHGEQTDLTFDSNVDMISREGVAYQAEKGGKITAKTTRAGGYKSIIAYANGVTDSITTTTGTTIGGRPSEITINGNIVAADGSIFAPSFNNYHSHNNKFTYQNIGAYAKSGGKIVIKGTTKDNDDLEDKAGDTNTNFDNKSLIYGIGAIATGERSIVTFDKTDNGVHIVTGDNGGLYASDYGTIEFNGTITNQNNITSDPNGTVPNSAGGRKGIYKASGGNDHENVTPFYVNRNLDSKILASNSKDTAGILFNKDTTINMYDGILLTGNRYGSTYDNNKGYALADYFKEDTSSADPDRYTAAKYRGMKNVTVELKGDNVNLGVINQYDNAEWKGISSTDQGHNTEYLASIAKYAGEMAGINNTDKHRFDSSLINSELKIKGTSDVDLEDKNLTDGRVVGVNKNDRFNDIKMESTLITIEDTAKVHGDIANRATQNYLGKDNGQVQNAGLSMNNSLSRWSTLNGQNPDWEKTDNTKSGVINKGKIDFTGGNDVTGNIAGINVTYGTVINDGSKNEGEIKIDRGYAIFATDGSIIQNINKAKIDVTGSYVATSPVGGRNKNVSSDTQPKGNNYGIVGISDGRNDNNYAQTNLGTTSLVNTLDITNEDSTIKVEGDLAVGIYGENRNKADSSKVKITYKDTGLTTAGIDVENQNVTDSKARGVGIALVNSETNYKNGAINAGGEIVLNGRTNTLGSFGASNNNILTGKNGIGIYAESSKITLDSKDFTVETADDGVGLWATDDSNIGIGANHQKTFQYNYNGANDKNGFAMAFTGRNVQDTIAQNDLDIKFTNVADTADVNLVNEANTTRKGTNKGIAGILVNTDGANDVVNNYGNIEEDKSSVTNLRAYGAVVNKGTFVNYGDIKLNDSLMPNQASDVTSADMKKVNVGIFANRENGLATTIENHGDITIGKDANSDKNIGSWAIYGYNVKTGAKPDGTDSVITINRNSYGIYSGDGNVDIQKTKLKVGNDKVLGHVMHTWTDDAGTVHNIDRQNGNYAQSKDLLSGLDKPRELDNAIGIYIDKGASNTPRKLNLSADMDIDRFSYGIVLAEKNGGAQTDVTIGTPTDAPTIRLAYSTNNNLGGHVKSTAPTKVPKVIADEVLEQGNAVYYYSADNNSRATSYANVTMDGDYNTAYYTKGSVANYGTIDLRSKYDVDNHNVDLGYGNVGIFSANPDLPSVNYGTITTSMSDTGNMRYSAAMAAGRNYYKNVLNTNGKYENKYDRTEEQGYIVNEGNIVVKENAGIGMFATGSRSRAINKGTIKLEGEESIGMYLDQGAIGENYGTITGNQRNLKGVVAINGGYIKNYGTISVTGTGSNGIVTDGSKFIVDANGNPTEVLESTDPRYNTSAATTAVQNNGGNGGKDLYGGSESSLEEGTSGNPKTTGVGTTITMPDVAPLTTISVDGVNTPIFTVDTNAPAASVANPNGWGDKISITSSIQTGGTRIIDLSELDGWGNKMWNNYQTDQLSEVTSVGMYVDTSGVRYTNPINGLNNLSKLAKVNLYFGPEATQYTNAKAIRLGNQLIKPFNDALNNLPGGAVVNPLSASLTWQVAAKLDDNNQLTDVYMSKVPYHSFAFDDDTSLVNFTNNLDNVYEIVDLHTNEKEIFNKLNSLGNGEGHILAQAFDQMRAHIYGGIQQRTVATEKIFDSQVSGVMSSNGMVGNPSKDSTKYKAFGERGEYKTDTKGIPDYENYAGGFVAVHEGESIYKGEKHGWYTGVVDNNFSFKDIARSHENQAMIKGGLFKTTPFDVNGEFTWTIAGEGYFGRTDTNRRFWVVDKQYDAEAHYYTYGVALKNELAKSFRLSEGFAIKPHVGIDLEYGRYSSFHEDGTMSLDVKGNDYHSIKPNLGVDFTYKQPVFKKSMFVASLGLGYEKELGRVNDVTNEARIQGAWTDYFSIRGDKENKKGNYKADLNLGIDNGRLGFTVNAGYDSTGKNFRGGAGLRFIF